MKTQNYSNHVRWYPLVHFVIVPLLLLNLVYQSVRLYQEPSVDRFVWLLLAVTLILMNLAARLQPLRAQDRLIRLEEQLRYAQVLGSDHANKASILDLGQILALRFASDDELPELIRRIEDGSLKSSREIKRAIDNWRGDYLRI